MRKTFFLIFLFIQSLVYAQKVTLSGYIKDAKNNESLPYVNILLKSSNEGTYSNSYGFYSIAIPADKEIELVISSVGFQTLSKKINTSENITVVIELVSETINLDEVSIVAEIDNDKPVQLNLARLSIKSIKELPSLFGEKDVLKVLQLLPGVQRGVEGTTSIYVRGGGAGQNLILLDEAPVYNANHIFGFLSTFNGDAIKDVQFWKGAGPARYGGRVSSIIDLQMREGNKEKIKGEGGIGILSSRITLDGPIKKDKSSFLFSTRRSYIDLLMRPLMSSESKTINRFYDVNAKYNIIINPSNRIFISTYFGNDKFFEKEEISRTQSTINTKSSLDWGNSTATARWNRIISEKIFSNATLLFSDYRFNLFDDYEKSGLNANTYTSEYSSSVRDYGVKYDVDYFLSNTHNFKTGLFLTFHNYKPSAYATKNGIEGTSFNKSQTYTNQELGIYIEDTWKPSERWLANLGLRLNGLNSSQKFYLRPEPRLNISYNTPWNILLSGSYYRANQFVHQLSNTGLGLSTDLWVPVTNLAPPQQSDQVSGGVSKSFNNNAITISFESYRKYLRNIISYKEGASFLVLNDGASEISWEDNITTGKGLAYGNEFLIQKNNGKLTGWIGYTLSWTIHQFEELNGGKKFFPKEDRRHNINITTLYKLNSRITFSAIWVYNSGQSLFVPSGFYYGNFANGVDMSGILDNNGGRNEIITESIDNVAYFGSRNSFRAESYHRLDFNIQFHKKKKRFERTWEFGIYNVYNRKNPFNYYLERTQNLSGGFQTIELKKRSLFPILPSISYNFQF